MRPRIIIIAGPNGAGKTTFARIDEIARERRSFAFETTLSGLVDSQRIKRWRAAGYHVKHMFLSRPNSDAALQRVRMRVAQGGHDVPEATVRRRIDAGLRNFESIYRPSVNSWVLDQNSGSAPMLIASGGVE